MIPKGDYQKSNSDDWATPKSLYNKIKNAGYIDPCPLHSTNNCLKDKYTNCKLYINPPFSKLNEFCTWAIEQYNRGCEILLLMPARTDTRYFHLLLEYNPKIYFFKGRLSFNDCGIKAPFPTLLIHLNYKNKKEYDILIA